MQLESLRTSFTTLNALHEIRLQIQLRHFQNCPLARNYATITFTYLLLNSPTLVLYNKLNSIMGKQLTTLSFVFPFVLKSTVHLKNLEKCLSNNGLLLSNQYLI